MSDDRYWLLSVIEDLYHNVLENVPILTKDLRCSLADAKEVLVEAGLLEDE